MLIPFLHYLTLLVFLLIGHAIADVPLQRALRLSYLKRRARRPGGMWWLTALTIHAGSQGMFVAVLTGSGLIGMVEMLCHGVADYAKTEGYLNTIQDQAFHVLCKIIWVIWIWKMPHLSIYEGR